MEALKDKEKIREFLIWWLMEFGTESVNYFKMKREEMYTKQRNGGWLTMLQKQGYMHSYGNTYQISDEGIKAIKTWKL